MDEKIYLKEKSFIPSSTCKNAADVITFCKDKKVKYIDLKFMDSPGLWQHYTIPISELSEDLFENGSGFDGSSIRGWKSIESSDMLVVPDPSTAMIDPFCELPTLSLICDIEDPITRERYNRDPRNIAKNAEEYLKQTGIGDTIYMGPEAEFFIFDDVRFNYSANNGSFFVDSDEGIWNSNREESPNLGYKIRHKQGYFPVPPHDSLQNLRSEMTEVMIRCGLNVECQHHEVATAGQAEIDLRFNNLLKIADELMLYKYIIKNVAKANGKTVTFMPKPLFGDNGTGMHTHQSIWKGGKPLFAGEKYAGLSESALYYIGGILKHAKSLNALTNPSTNSYKRLVPGFEAPVNLAYSSRNRSASVRIPQYSQSPKAKRIEVRFPDPSCNPYLAFSAMLMAGLDGIQNKIHPGEPMDKNIYDLPPEELQNIPSVCGSLDEALTSLGNDHEYLLKGDVFTSDFVEAWIDYKKENEVDAINLRPHPYEFMLYYDI
jgi:glutamine synthetase